MVELVPVTAGVVTCVADPRAIDRVAASTSGTVVRVAPDEALVVTSAAGALVGEASAVVTAIDADAIVLDTTDGWAIWALEGEDAPGAFSRLSQLPLPDGVAQAEVAQIPATVVAEPGRIVLLFPAMWREAARERILADGATLGMVERDGPQPWAPTGARA